MQKADGRPLHEKVFQIKAAIRRAGFVASGRTRLDKDGRVVMGVIVPVAFPPGDLTVEQVWDALRERIEPTQEQCKASYEADLAGRPGRSVTTLVRPNDLRTAAGRRWKREHAGAAT